MKFGIFLILLSCCFYLATARPNDSDTESEVNSENVLGDRSDTDESDDDTTGSDSDENDNPMGRIEPLFYGGLTLEQETLMKKLVENRERDHKQGKKICSADSFNRLRRLLMKCFRMELIKNGDVDIQLMDESLYDWRVIMKRFDTNSQLVEDLQEVNRTNGIDSIVLHLKFNDRYPVDPPFARIVSPVITGGNVLEGGAILIGILAPEGWMPTYTIDAVLMEIIFGVINGEGRILQQDKDYARSHYSYDAALNGYKNWKRA